MNPQKSDPTWGYEVRWTEFNGDEQRLSSDGHITLDDAKRHAFGCASLCGWTQPKWWQWWRRNDTRKSTENVTVVEPATLDSALPKDVPGVGCDDLVRHCCGSCIYKATGNGGGWGRFTSPENPRKTEWCAVCDHRAEGLDMSVSSHKFGGFRILPNH